MATLAETLHIAVQEWADREGLTYDNFNFSREQQDKTTGLRWRIKGDHLTHEFYKQ